jgi:hypothetical protein
VCRGVARIEGLDAQFLCGYVGGCADDRNDGEEAEAARAERERDVDDGHAGGCAGRALDQLSDRVSRAKSLETFGCGRVEDAADGLAPAAFEQLGHDGVPVHHGVADRAGLDHEVEHVRRRG